MNFTKGQIVIRVKHKSYSNFATGTIFKVLDVEDDFLDVEALSNIVRLCPGYVRSNDSISKEDLMPLSPAKPILKA